MLRHQFIGGVCRACKVRRRYVEHLSRWFYLVNGAWSDARPECVDAPAPRVPSLDETLAHIHAAHGNTMRAMGDD